MDANTLIAFETIKEAEERATQIKNEAMKTANQLMKGAEVEAENEYKRIIMEGKQQAEEVKQQAVVKGEKEAEPIIEQGLDKVREIRNLPDAKRNTATKIIMERIVKTNGNRKNE